jgi:hypothetical protein
MSDKLEEAQKSGQLLREFFDVNQISKDVACTAMLGLYMSACSEMGVPYKQMKKVFDKCLERYRKE